MLSHEQYIARSLDLHLFFARLMKEHAIFLKAALSPVNQDLQAQSESYKGKFEEMLLALVKVSAGHLSQGVNASGELITSFTLGIEQKTQKLTGIAINQEITKLEGSLRADPKKQIKAGLFQHIKKINQYALPLIDKFLSFKQKLLDDVSSCTILLNFYPLNIVHVIHEAQYYKDALMKLERGEDPESFAAEDIASFWNTIMMQHAVFVRGLLDPSESEFIDKANDYARIYQALTERLEALQEEALEQITADACRDTQDYAGFSADIADGVAGCRIQSILLPLIADHNLRETNHYLRLLEEMKQ